MKTNVTFPSAGWQLSGHLYTPDGDPAGPLQPIVIPHPWGGVKEQTATVYARRLARDGFACLVFDSAHHGESEGEPRHLENPFQRAEDIKNAVSYLTTCEGLDTDRIAALGLFASGGYVPYAAQTDPRIKAVATVAAVDIGAMLREGLTGGQTEDHIRGMLAEAARLRTAEAHGNPPHLERILPATKQETVDLPVTIQEGWDYYMTERGGHPRAQNVFVLRSVDHIMQYDPYAMIRLLAPRPLLMIEGTASDTVHYSRRAVELAVGPTELFWIEGATHMDLYDRDEHVSPAVAKLSEFFRQL
ncbi:alpha/beta hydrolase [Streptomyces sp. V2]|uniref:alpha/beta hydrolase n=1 Tax=Streptomyces TaxID=1883 RepID=UPI0006EBC44B|nr:MULTISPECIES: alpha/beta hydrolase [Streptomyces]PWG11839.1 alpha/beta hydrolase [Streptomyces sp. V2]